MQEISQELVADFMNEAFELVQKMENSLLVLENNPTDKAAVAEIFRAAHTIKGGAGTIGFTEIKEFTHKVEDLLDRVRKSEIAVTPDLVSLLLRCKDVIEGMLDARQNGDVYVGELAEDIMKELGEYLGKQPPDPTASSQEGKTSNQSEGKASLSYLTAYERSVILEFLHQNFPVYELWYVFNENYEMKDVSAFQIYALVGDFAQIIRMEPSLEIVEKEFRPDFRLVVMTDKDEDFIRQKTFMKDLVTSLQIRRIRNNDIENLETQIMKGQSLETAPSVTEMEKSSLPQPSENPSSKKTTLSSDAQESVRMSTTLRVESTRIDELMNLVGELVINKSLLHEISQMMVKSHSNIRLFFKSFLSGIALLPLDENIETNRELNYHLREDFHQLETSLEQYQEILQRFNQISSALQENVTGLRMVPIQQVFSRFPRLVRDQAQKLGKQITLEIEGVETEIDKGMVDDLFDPLIHILRNSIDHGIEKPEERAAKGKSPQGKILLRAYHEGENVYIEVSDDGLGIDIDRVKQKAIEKGLISSATAENLSAKEALALIFLPGFSTAQEVTELSGRGVGMDVVKKKIEQLGGSVSLSTARDKGTKIQIKLPLTLAIIQGLHVLISGFSYILPIVSIDETMIVQPEDLVDIEGDPHINVRGEFVPVFSLRRFFYHESESFRSSFYCILAKQGEKHYGLVVDEIVGEQDVVIKPFNNRLIKSPGISAGTIIGNGNIGYIVDLNGVIQSYKDIVGQKGENHGNSQ
ncbi:chemotaxis protein CheA [Thermospira aquatica]|uniref:Chemotaxis protein CheA n=1 Tax=Thermospira aquatica TaxID=2828656 RepID=A0AAX3BBC2_9SPIR|nr:chemotaxis protein CheA [Thermospira aquatica]URA09518.1 chemotaxis protein CheA [Thermospira aquatica]